MKKKKLITEIKSIIEDYGGFTTADVEAESSPCVNSMRGAVQLAEHFYKHGIEAVTYETRYDNEMGSELFKYEDLKTDVLEQILNLAQRWKEMNED